MRCVTALIPKLVVTSVLTGTNSPRRTPASSYVLMALSSSETAASAIGSGVLLVASFGRPTNVAARKKIASSLISDAAGVHLTMMNGIDSSLVY